MLSRGLRNLKRARLNNETINPKVLNAEYAVRGRVVLEAERLQQQLDETPNAFAFKRLISCNIGNPQELRQKPLTYNRQILSLFTNPTMLADPAFRAFYPQDVLDQADALHHLCTDSNGGYTHSKGLEFVRKSVAEFIMRRDGTGVNPEHIFITDGASVGAKMLLELALTGPNDAIMVPIPQYPLYSASITLNGGSQIGYYLDEDNQWSLKVSALEKALVEARKANPAVKPKALVVINPGNPTGAVLSEQNIMEVIEWANRNEIMIIADEVYQENVYVDSKPFISFNKVLSNMGQQYDTLELASLHSTSKGIIGECGLRGGYVQLTNFHEDAIAQLYKLASVCLCPNVIGQITLYLMMSPPVVGSPSYSLFHKEYTEIYESLKRRALKLSLALNELEGVKCNTIEGAMYSFARITLPPKAIAKAAEENVKPDMLYALECLKSTGVKVVPGSGFGQLPGTYHFRSTILPPEKEMDEVCERIKKFHEDFLLKYA